MSWWRRSQRDRELDEEIQSHLQMAARDRQSAGSRDAAAQAAARQEFGNVALVKEVTREQWGWTWLERLAQDLRYGVRMLVKSPGFSLVALITLALGIGANTALFSIVNAVLLKPLPYPHPEQLVTLHMSKPNFETGAISYPNFKDWQAQNHTFSAMALSRGNAVSLFGMGEAEYLRAQLITSDFFPILGVKPVLGRNFEKGEDEPDGPPLVQISEGFWKRKFGATPDILGTSLNLSGTSYTVVGVIPADFELELINFRPTDIYLPLGQWHNGALKMRGAPLGLHGIGRLKPGVTLEQARADMDAVSQNLASAYPELNRGNKANLIPLKRSMTGSVQPVLLVLLGAVAFVLLIACVNVASLLLARSQARLREFAVRAALGASRSRMLRQLLTESVLLALAGCAAGVLLARWAVEAAPGLAPRALPRLHNLNLDWHVLLFSVTLSVFAGIAFGLAPAFKMAHADLQMALQAASRRSSGEHRRTQRTLVVMEIAAALILLIGAGLMLRTLTRLWSVDPGFDTHNLLTFGVGLSPSMDKANPAATRAALRQLHDALESMPGVVAASFRNGAVPFRSDDELLFWMAGQPQPRSDSEMNWSLRYIVQPSYLRVMKIPLRRGRFFAAQDNEKSPRVLVVDEVFAATFFPQQDAIGKRIRWRDHNVALDGEIVGIVGHIKHWGLDSDDSNSLRAQVYQDYDQNSDDELETSTGVSLRTSGPPLPMVQTLMHRVQQLNAESVLFTPASMDDAVQQSLATQQFSMVLLAAFAGLALLLAAVGIYGVIAYLVGQRTQEFGIRMALGASPGSVLRLVLGQGARMAMIGIGIGLAAALLLTRLLAKMLYGVKPSDPLTYVAVALLLGAVALLACWIPGRRAVRVDPMVALRYE